MTDTEGRQAIEAIVAAVRRRLRPQGRCTCGWVGKPRLLMASAKTDALIHAAQKGCEPALPLSQPEIVLVRRPRGILAVECPAGCGATLSVPISVSDRLSSSEPFAAESPELHERIDTHLHECAALNSWITSLRAPQSEAPVTPSAKRTSA